MVTKVIRIGNSLGIIIPSHMVKEMGLKVDDPLHMEYIQEIESIVVSKNKKDIAETKNLYKAIEGFNKKYRIWLKKNSKKVGR